MQLGRIIDDARLDLGLTAREVADAARITTETLRRWRRGEVRPSPPALSRVAHVLGLPRHKLESVAQADAELRAQATQQVECN